jgi:hypothetical protein
MTTDLPAAEPTSHRERLLAALGERRKRMMHEGHIDNSELYAGSDMYYYCKYCGILSDQLPETWWLNPPSRICDHCQTLIEFGWHDGERPLFPRRKG